MSAAVEDSATIHELTRYVEHEHRDLDTSYNARREQLVVVGQPGNPEPPAALREVIDSSDFELRAHGVASRGRWIGVVNAGDNDGDDQ